MNDKRVCCICGVQDATDDNLTCEDCKDIYNGEVFYSVLDEVIHGRLATDEGRAVLRRLGRQKVADSKT